MRVMNDGVRFLPELATLVTVAWFCWRQPDRVYAKVLLAVGAPVVIAAVDHTAVAPRTGGLPVRTAGTWLRGRHGAPAPGS